MKLNFVPFYKKSAPECPYGDFHTNFEDATALPLARPATAILLMLYFTPKRAQYFLFPQKCLTTEPLPTTLLKWSLELHHFFSVKAIPSDVIMHYHLTMEDGS